MLRKCKSEFTTIGLITVNYTKTVKRDKGKKEELTMCSETFLIDL